MLEGYKYKALNQSTTKVLSFGEICSLIFSFIFRLSIIRNTLSRKWNIPLSLKNQQRCQNGSIKEEKVKRAVIKLNYFICKVMPSSRDIVHSAKVHDIAKSRIALDVIE